MRLPVLTILLLLPVTVFAQALSVYGGNKWARACFDNAELAARDKDIVSRSMLESCDSALEHISLKPKDRAATHANRGIIRAAGNNIDAAMEDYSRAMEILPDSAEVHVNRGNAYFLGSDYAMALSDYERAIALGIRQLHIVHFNMGMAFEKLGNDRAAEVQFRSALELDPDWTLAESRLARLLERRDRKETEK